MTMRRELRETLQWCLNQHFPFRAADICEAFGQQHSLVNRKMRVLIRMGLIEREQLIGMGMPFQYRVINRERASEYVNQQPRIRYEKAPEPQRYTPKASFVFHMGM